MNNRLASFIPRYTITSKLLETIKKISAHIAVLNTRRFPKIVLAEFERHAREVSSYSSTSIEGNPLPLTEVRKILKNLPLNVTDSQKEVLNYNQVIVKLNEAIAKNKNPAFNISLILDIHKTVVQGLLTKGSCGALRNEPVFVNEPRLRKTVYWPPDQQHVPILLNELTGFVKNNRARLDPIVLSGIFHKQFVIIHPFIDGNGRTARLATKLLLAGVGLNTFNLFSFENYYNRNITRYFQSVGAYGNYYDIAETLDFTSWLEYFAEGILDELYRISKELDKAVVDPSTELKDYHKKMLKYAEDKGIIYDRDYAKLTDRAKPTRALDFKKMIELGYIERLGKGKATYYKPKKRE